MGIVELLVVLAGLGLLLAVILPQFSKVRENPYGLGKTLSCPWFRELKNDKFRAYYLIYGEKIIVLFVSVSDKKNQQAFIDKIKNNFAAFKELVENEKNLNDKHFVGVK